MPSSMASDLGFEKSRKWENAESMEKMLFLYEEQTLKP